LISCVWAQKEVDTSPKFFGYVRSWYQADFSTDENEFIVKMSRVGVKGNVNEYAGYRLFVDFSRLGSLSTETDEIDSQTVVTDTKATFSNFLLDAHVDIKPSKGLTLSLGQFKIPFSTDNLRSAAEIDFVNRPLIYKNITPGLRDIGFMGKYATKGDVPIELTAGLFNGSGQNKSENNKTTDLSLRGVVKPIKGLGLSANYYNGKNSGSDISIYDFGADFKIGKIFFCSEFGQRETTTGNSEISANGFFVYALYEISTNKTFISHVIPGVRFDLVDPNTSLDDDEISRITAGLTLQFLKAKFAQLRINYELYDYKDGRSNPDKLIIELQTKF
jgi:hypothetical protein